MGERSRTDRGIMNSRWGRRRRFSTGFDHPKSRSRRTALGQQRTPLTTLPTVCQRWVQGIHIRQLAANSGTTACMDRMEIADTRNRHSHRVRLEPLTSRLCNIGVLRQHDQPMPVDSSQNVGQYSGAGRNELPGLRGDSRKGPYRARSGNVCVRET